MKTIGIIGIPRSGSTFLLEHFPNVNCGPHTPMLSDLSTSQCNVHEIFSGHVPSHATIIKNALVNASVSPGLTNYISNVFAQYAGNERNPYNLDLLTSLQSIYSYTDYFVFKILQNQLIPGVVTLDNVYGITDHMIFNYRKSIIRSYISLRLASQTGTWNIRHFHEHEDDYVTTQVKNADNKIQWDPRDYLKYVENTCKMYAKWEPYIDKTNTTLIQYETLANHSIEPVVQLQNIFESNDIPVTLLERIENKYDFKTLEKSPPGICLEQSPLVKLHQKELHEYFENKNDFLQFADIHGEEIFEYIDFDEYIN